MFVARLPGWQSDHREQLEALSMDEYSPFLQGTQVRSATLVPPPETDSPGIHGVKGEQDIALMLLLNVPSAQTEQVLSAVADPAFITE